MATNIPPHNLGEVVDGLTRADRQPGDRPIDELMEIVPGPDFPTGGIIHGREGIREAYAHRPRPHPDARARRDRDRTARATAQAIVVTEIPYQVNKAHADRAASPTWCATRRIEGITRPARRVRPRRHARRHRAQARRRSPRSSSTSSTSSRQLQTTFGVIMLALVDGQPAGADAQGDAAALRRLPRRGRRPAHALRAAQGRGAGPHPRGLSRSRSTTSTRSSPRSAPAAPRPTPASG